MLDKPDPQNPFNDPALAQGYETWYETHGRRADRLEKKLLKWLLRHFPEVETILEVGCGTGHFTRWFKSQGLTTTGLDVSPVMLDQAKRQKGSTYLQADAHHLPFASRTFDLVAFITTLEFLVDPVKALKEANRVATQGLLIGAINRESWVGREYQRQGGPVWESAQLFTLGEVLKMVQPIYGRTSKVFWRTTLWRRMPCMLPLPQGGFIGFGLRFISK